MRRRRSSKVEEEERDLGGNPEEQPATEVKGRFQERVGFNKVKIKKLRRIKVKAPI